MNLVLAFFSGKIDTSVPVAIAFDVSLRGSTTFIEVSYIGIEPRPNV